MFQLVWTIHCHETIKDLWLGIGSAEEARIQRFNLSISIILQELATKDINVERI